MHLCLLIKIPDLGCLYIWKEQGSLEQKQITRANWKVRRSSQKGIISWVHNLPRRGVLEPCLPVLTQQPDGRRLSSPETAPMEALFSILSSWPQGLRLTSEGRTERIWMDAYFQIWISVTSLGPHLLNWKMRGLDSTSRKVSPSADNTA